MTNFCHQCHHVWEAHDDGSDDGDYCRVCECDGFVGDQVVTETPCKCCGLEPADPADPDGFCIECGIECADWVGSGCPGLAEDDDPSS